MTNQSTGNYGETLACEYLKKQGYEIIDRNYRIRGGEIDIVAMDEEYMVFVEVKTRSSHDFGLPVESMTPWKIRHLLRAAQFYLLKIDWRNKPYRIDFISIDFADDKNSPQIELIKDITN